MKSLITNFITWTFLMAGSTLYGQLNLSADRMIITNEAGINTEHLEYSPAFYKDGIVFITTKFPSLNYKVKDARIGMNIMSIYNANRTADGLLMNPRPLASELSSKLHEGPVTFNRTAETIFFTRNESLSSGEKSEKKKSRKKTKKLRIFSGELVGEEWVNITDLPFNQDGSNTCHPAVSVDGDALFFASDRPGGYGGMDIYVSKKAGQRWGPPVNLGKDVNTPLNEVFPFFHADGTLYFSSNGRDTTDNLDIFLTSFDGHQWSAPQSLGEPFNSTYDDFGIIVDRDVKNGYFSSDRPGGSGGDDIYSFYVSGGSAIAEAAHARDLHVKVIDKENSDVLENAIVTYMNLDGFVLSETSLVNSKAKEEIFLLKSVNDNQDQLNFILDSSEQGGSGQTDSEGIYPFSIAGGNYFLKVTRDGYLPLQLAFSGENPGEEIIVALDKAVDCIPFSGNVLNDLLKNYQSGARISIQDLETKEVFTVSTDINGIFDFCLKCNRQYAVSASISGAFSQPEIISTKDVDCTSATKLSTDLTLSSPASTPFAEGTVIQLPNIYYNFDDASLRPDALGDLNKVVRMMNAYPIMKIELASHTDARGGSRYNSDLSQRRADNAIAYLIDQGISPDRVKPMGYGETQIRNQCLDGIRCSEQDHQYNRRTEVKIVMFNPSDEDINQKHYNSSPDEHSFGSIPQKPSDQSTNKPHPATLVSSRTNTGTFGVIAGSFRNSENAQKQLQKLEDLGFSQVEIYQKKDLRQVCVEKFVDKSDAYALAKALKERYQVEAYVKKM